MRNLKKIALDFDSVLSDTMIAWTIKYNKKHGTKYTKDHIESWSFWKQKEFNFDKPYADIFFRESWEDWKNLPPTEQDLDKKITKLSEFGTVDILTSIEPNYTKNVESWINDKDISLKIISSFSKNKIDDFNYDLYIDDDPVLVEYACSKNKKCFVYNQKWNCDIKTCENVYRIHSLTDAIENISKNNI